MAYLDGVYFRAASAGTGDFVVSAAITGYRTPADASAVNGGVYGYRAESDNLSEWEFGVTTYTVSGTSCSRTVVGNSLGTTAKISFTAAPKVGFVELSSQLADAGNLLSGTVAPARLGSGVVGSGTKFLADNSTFQTLPPSGWIQIGSTQTLGSNTTSVEQAWTAGAYRQVMVIGNSKEASNAGAVLNFDLRTSSGSVLASNYGTTNLPQSPQTVFKAIATIMPGISTSLVTSVTVIGSSDAAQAFWGTNSATVPDRLRVLTQISNQLATGSSFAFFGMP